MILVFEEGKSMFKFNGKAILQLSQFSFLIIIMLINSGCLFGLLGEDEVEILSNEHSETRDIAEEGVDNAADAQAAADRAQAFADQGILDAAEAQAAADAAQATADRRQLGVFVYDENDQFIGTPISDQRFHNGYFTLAMDSGYIAEINFNGDYRNTMNDYHKAFTNRDCQPDANGSLIYLERMTNNNDDDWFPNEQTRYTRAFLKFDDQQNVCYISSETPRGFTTSFERNDYQSYYQTILTYADDNEVNGEEVRNRFTETFSKWVQVDEDCNADNENCEEVELELEVEYKYVKVCQNRGDEHHDLGGNYWNLSYDQAEAREIPDEARVHDFTLYGIDYKCSQLTDELKESFGLPQSIGRELRLSPAL